MEENLFPKKDKDLEHVLTLPSCHGGRVWGVKFSPVDSRVMASCGEDSTVVFWLFSQDFARATMLRCLGDREGVPAHSRSIRSISFDNSGSWLAAASFDGRVSLWKVPSLEDFIRREAYSGLVCKFRAHESEVKCAEFPELSEPRYIATSGRDSELPSQSRQTAKTEVECVAILQNHTQDVKSVVWLQNFQLISCSYDGTIIVWLPDLLGDWLPTQVLQISTGSSVLSVSFSKISGVLIASDDSGRICCWKSDPKNYVGALCEKDLWPISRVFRGYRALLSASKRAKAPNFALSWCATTGNSFPLSAFVLLSSGFARVLFVDKFRNFRLANSAVCESLSFTECCRHSDDVNSLAATLAEGFGFVVASASDDDSIRLWKSYIAV